MDTNTLTALMQLMAPQKAPTDTALEIAKLTLAALGPILSALAVWFASRAASNTAEAKQASVETADGVEKIHLAVNSERTAMLEKVDQREQEILRLSKENKTLEEHGRGQEMREAASRPTTSIAPAPDRLEKLLASLEALLEKSK